MQSCHALARRLSTRWPRRPCATAPAFFSSSARPKAVDLNAGRLNYDGRISYERLCAVADVVHHEASDASDAATIVRRAEGARILITKEMRVDASLIGSLPDSVELICEAGTGYNNIDIAAARERGIDVSNVPTYSTEAMATMAITFMMALSCSLVRQQHALFGGDNAHFARECLGSLPHFELEGKTLGLVGGMGNIGKRVTQMALAFGMKVVVSGREGSASALDPAVAASGRVSVAPLHEMLSASDFVSIHCPLNERTRGLIGAAELACMRPSAYLINTARGAIVDESSLLAALRADGIAGAALDVHHVEPFPAEHPLRELSPHKVLLTPHVGWQRIESRQRLVDTVADNICAWRDGRVRQDGNVVN